MSAPENPPAFPSVEVHPSYDMPVHHFGMSLRDYFAGQALAGFMTGARNLGVARPSVRHDLLAATAVTIYEMADAMLAESKRGRP